MLIQRQAAPHEAFPLWPSMPAPVGLSENGKGFACRSRANGVNSKSGIVMHDATVSELLKHKASNLWCIAPDAMVFEAIQTMADKNIGALLVMSGGKLIGVVSERDYTRKVALKGKSSKETPVK